MPTNKVVQVTGGETGVYALMSDGTLWWSADPNSKDYDKQPGYTAVWSQCTTPRSS